MMMAALRLNIPAVFVSGGPMEAGKVNWNGQARAVDLIDAMIEAADSRNVDEDIERMERSACPTCVSSILRPGPLRYSDLAHLDIDILHHFAGVGLSAPAGVKPGDAR